MSTQAGRPARPARYGAPRRQPSPALRRALVAVGLLAAVAAVTLAWAVSRPKVQAVVTGIRFVSAHRVDVTFEVRKPAGDRAECVVRARDGRGAQAGYAVVPIGPAADDTVTVTHRLPTTARAVTGEVVGCRLTGGG